MIIFVLVWLVDRRYIIMVSFHVMGWFHSIIVMDIDESVRPDKNVSVDS